MIDTEILKWILYGILAIYMIGLIITFFMDRISVKTGKFSESYINQCDLVYYLPTANVEVKCTAKITITKEEAGTIIIDTQLAEQSFEFTPKIAPDTNNPIALRYQPSIYANDELTLRVNELGLLESINVLAEDRLPEVANQVTTAPQLILKPSPPL